MSETFTVHFTSPDAENCSTNMSAFIMILAAPAFEQVYMIDTNKNPPDEMKIKPDFFELSMECPTICTLYEGNSLEPKGLPQASDPAYKSFNIFTGELTVATNKLSYAGTRHPLTIECVASRQVGGYLSVQFEVVFTVPNGCFATIDHT